MVMQAISVKVNPTHTHAPPETGAAALTKPIHFIILTLIFPVMTGIKRPILS